MTEETTVQQYDNSKISQPTTDAKHLQAVEVPLLTSVPTAEVKQAKTKMPLFRKKLPTEQAIAGGGDSSMFGITLNQLKELMEVRGKDLTEKLHASKYNGVQGILDKLKVDPSKGLDSNNKQDLEQRRIAYGKNEIPPKPMKTFLELCWDALHDVLLVILLVCAVISIGLSFYKPPQEEGAENQNESNLEWIEGAAILVAVLVVVFVTAFNDWRKERQFRGLQNKIERDQQASVVRNHSIQQIPVSELVVGDICFIKYGDLLPADGLVVQSNDLKVDESSITGETDLVKKNEHGDAGLLSGTQVMEGSGRMIVVGVGLNSQVGLIMTLLGATDGDSVKNKTNTKKKKNDNEQKKSTKLKSLSSTKVSPDKIQTDDHECIGSKVLVDNDKDLVTTQMPTIRKSSSKQSTNTESDTRKSATQEDQDKCSEINDKNASNRQLTTSSPDGQKSIGSTKTNENEDDRKGESKMGKQKSVLQAKLTRLALYIGYIGMAAAALTLISLIIRFCITNYVIRKQKAKGSDVGYFISFLIQAITVVVVSVPEGLPLAVTLALAYAVRKMMTDNNLVRHLDACETMGNATTICSDKTGTLTTNRMTVVQCYITGQYYATIPKYEELDKAYLTLLFESIAVNTSYTSKIEASKVDGDLPKQIGNKTECALLDLMLKWNGSYETIRERIPENEFVKVYTFNSARKMMSTIIQHDRAYRLYTKGAAEIVLRKCKSIINKNSEPIDLTDYERSQITRNVIETMADNGLRTICIAYKDYGKWEQDWDDENKIISDLTCIAIVGIEDPVRPEVPEAIQRCREAGVVVRMVTGDNVVTARTIAMKCGILKPNENFLVLEGKEFNKRIRDSSGKISQQKLDEIWPALRVLARSSPQDKYNLVSGIVESHVSQHREVVAVTGDGTNDGPALKRADVGFAMGIQGTDVAKQASDIILTDDNFTSIVKAMVWGRNVYDCIAKFLQFQLTANLSAGAISVISAAAISSVPLRAVPMLWVNLVMDTLASLALATEPPTDDLLNRKPYGRTKSIISSLMLRNILGQSLYQLTVMFVILYAGQYFLEVESTVIKIQSDPHVAKELSEQFTMVFNAFVLMTLFNEINARKLHGERNVFKGIFGNPFFYGIWLFCFSAQILIVTFGDKVFSCARLNVKKWAWCLLFGVGSLIWQQILLFIPIEPFSKCFSVLCRICCPCCCKTREVKARETQETGEDRAGRENERRDSVDDVDDDEYTKYMTIGQLTNATMVTEPPPAFVRYMLRKSVDRLTMEFRVITGFRSVLEEIQEKRGEETLGHKHLSQADSIDE